MSVTLSSGHGQFVRGAKGPSGWGLDEVDEARKVVDEVAKYLRTGNIAVTTYHDNSSRTVNANLNAIVAAHKKAARSNNVSVHFNAYQVSTTREMGVEVLYRNAAQKTLATQVSKAISGAVRLPDRGAKQRTNLYFLNNLSNAILLEVCFVDAKLDADAYRARFAAVTTAIAQSLGASTTPPPPEPPPSGRPVVKRGSKGEHVVSLQRTLGLPADGDFGTITETWVKAFQRAHGVTADGIVGPVSWRLVDELELRIEAGNDGMAEDLEGAIDQAVMRSGIQSITWPNRGRAPAGYYMGMAKAFGLAVERYRKGDLASAIMAGAASGNTELDALSFYKAELTAAGLSCDKPGLDTLRALWVFLVGLGMRESTGNHWKGKDPGASNSTGETCEAGLFQASWNLNTASAEIRKLFEEYRIDPNGFREAFTLDVPIKASELETYGTGTGTYYQWLAKFSPTFAAFMTAVGMRLRRKHWGPINRKEVTIDRRVADLLAEVQRLVENQVEPEPEPEEPEPITPEVPVQPEPGGAEVALNIAVTGNVVIKVPDQPIESEPSDDTPEIEITVRAKGSVAVSINQDSPAELIAHALIGTVRHGG